MLRSERRYRRGRAGAADEAGAWQATLPAHRRKPYIPDLPADNQTDIIVGNGAIPAIPNLSMCHLKCRKISAVHFQKS